MSGTAEHLFKTGQLAIFGGSWLVGAIVPELRRYPWKSKVFTSPRHIDDVVDSAGRTLRQVLEANGVTYRVSDEINSDPEAFEFAGPGTLGFAFGAAWVFEPEFVTRFGAGFVDFMGIPLPEYRGGAHYTWQLLHRRFDTTCNIQKVLGGTATFHKGPILKSRAHRFPPEARTPQDFFNAALKEEVKLVLEYLDDVQSGCVFKETALNEEHASFFPFLNTKKHGWVDWSWTTDEIVRFICAFDDPYAGASSTLNGKRVHLKSAHPHTADGAFHPFTQGLIYRANASGIFICARDGAVRVERVLSESGDDVTASLTPGDRLFTSTAQLESAKGAQIQYAASGEIIELK